MNVSSHVVRAAENLDYNQLVVVGIALNRSASQQHWVYVPQKDVVFHRYVWTSNYSPNNAPPGKSVVIAEITVPRNQPVNLDQLVEKTLEGFEKLNVFNRRGILFVKTWHHKYGYPVYTIGHKEAREEVITWLKEQGIETLGRWGQWRYWNMDRVLAKVLKKL